MALRQATGEMAKTDGKYIYCIIGCGGEPAFGPMGIGGRGEEVFSVAHRGVAAVVSSSPVTRYPVSRELTMAHQLVMEKAMEAHTVLPVRFNTIAEGDAGAGALERIRRQVLEERHGEFLDLLGKMAGKVELGLRAFWTDMAAIYSEIVAENPAICRLRDRLRGKRPEGNRDAFIDLGRMVQEALAAKKSREEGTILGELARLSAEFRRGKVVGDGVFANLTFLVEKAREGEFDGRVEALARRLAGRAKVRYVGPTPPSSFVEIHIEWK